MNALNRIKLKLQSPSRSPIDDHYDIAMKWWKKYCWQTWKETGDQYGNLCDQFRSEGITHNVALEVYKFWETSCWCDDEKDIMEIGKEAFLQLLAETYEGMDTKEGIQNQLDWCALHKSFRVPKTVEN